MVNTLIVHGRQELLEHLELGRWRILASVPRLTVETKAEGSNDYLRSIADRDSLKIAEQCISLEHITLERSIGTTVTAVLDNKNPISPEQVLRYLEPFVTLLPVPVYLNGSLISW